MTRLKTLYKQTFIYGIATVVPKMLSFLLVRLHTDASVLNNVSDYGDVSLIFAYFVLFNVLLTYGMETAFFRFINIVENKVKVIGTSAISLVISSSAVLVFGGFFKNNFSSIIHIDPEHIVLVLFILFFDTLVIIPFAYLRALGKPIKYTFVKITNVLINFGLNILFLIYLKGLAQGSSFWNNFYVPNFEIHYIFIANLIASIATLILLSSFYFKLNYNFDWLLWKKMLRYAFPVLVAGIAFSINESFDRILLERLLPQDLSKAAIGTYSACYKLALFMTLFSTAYRLGIEPFFFSSFDKSDAKKSYASILEVFVILGSLILLLVVVFIDFLKLVLIPNEAYWEAMSIVPILLLAYLFLGIYHALSVWYKVTDRTEIGAFISIFGALLTLIINIIFIPLIGYLASAIATLVAYTLMAIASYSLGQKYYTIPYNISKISIYLFLSILFSAISFYRFRGEYIIGLILIFILITIVLYNEKTTIRKFIKPEK